MLRCFDSGDAGGVAGARGCTGVGPGEQTGRCLFGMGVLGLRGIEVFRLRAGVRGGGVGECRIGAC